MMYTELYSFEGTAATDAKKTAYILEKVENAKPEAPEAEKLLAGKGSKIETIGSCLQNLTLKKPRKGK